MHTHNHFGKKTKRRIILRLELTVYLIIRCMQGERPESRADQKCSYCVCQNKMFSYRLHAVSIKLYLMLFIDLVSQNYARRSFINMANMILFCRLSAWRA